MTGLPGNRQAFVDVARQSRVDRTGEVHRIAAPTIVRRSLLIDRQGPTQDVRGAQEREHPVASHLPRERR